MENAGLVGALKSNLILSLLLRTGGWEKINTSPGCKEQAKAGDEVGGQDATPGLLAEGRQEVE